MRGRPPGALSGGSGVEKSPGTFLRLLSTPGGAGRAGPTSSRVSMADPGVVAAVLAVVLGAVPEELTESISPATSWISRARMAKSLARSWLILRTQGNNLLTTERPSAGGRGTHQRPQYTLYVTP